MYVPDSFKGCCQVGVREPERTFGPKLINYLKVELVPLLQSLSHQKPKYETICVPVLGIAVCFHFFMMLSNSQTPPGRWQIVLQFR